jgi:hypothetical protein
VRGRRCVKALIGGLELQLPIRDGADSGLGLRAQFRAK